MVNMPKSRHRLRFVAPLRFAIRLPFGPELMAEGRFSTTCHYPRKERSKVHD